MSFDAPPLAHRRVPDLLLRRAAEQPTSPFVSFPATGTSWTFGDFASEVTRVAGGLCGLGLERGDRIGIMLDNRGEYLLAWFGSLLAGTIDVAVNHGLRGPLLAHQLTTASVRVLITDGEGARAAEAVRADAPMLETIVTVEPRGGAVTFASLGAADPIPASRKSSAKETCTIRYTSGTTGPAKAVAMTHSRLTVFASQFVWLTDYGVDDRLYTCFPLHHGIASTLGVIATLVAGGSLVVDDRFSASTYWARIARHEATLAHVLGSLLPLLLAQRPEPTDNNHRCRRLWTAAPDVAFETRFRTRLINFYGQSEGGAITVIPPGETAPAGSSGRAAALFDVQVVDDDDYPVPPGELGQIVWRPREPHLMTPGYVGDPAATVRAWQNLWFHSGDEGRMDADGYLYLIGRTGDQIRRKGVNIAAVEIEAAATGYDAVLAAAAVAVPSPLGESEVKLSVVVDEESFEVADFRTHLDESLPREMLPRFLDVRDDLPRTDNHKIRKSVLRDEGVTADMIDFEAHRL